MDHARGSTWTRHGAQPGSGTRTVENLNKEVREVTAEVAQLKAQFDNLKLGQDKLLKAVQDLLDS